MPIDPNSSIKGFATDSNTKNPIITQTFMQKMQAPNGFLYQGVSPPDRCSLFTKAPQRLNTIPGSMQSSRKLLKHTAPAIKNNMSAYAYICNIFAVA